MREGERGRKGGRVVERKEEKRGWGGGDGEEGRGGRVEER